MLTVRQFFKIRVVFHTLYLWNEFGDPQFFFAFLSQVTHYLTAVKIWKKSVDWKIFARTSLSVHDMVFAAFGFILTQFLLEGFVTNTSQVICSDETQLFPG